MKVKDLIKELKKLDGEKKIVVVDGNDYNKGVVIIKL